MNTNKFLFFSPLICLSFFHFLLSFYLLNKAINEVNNILYISNKIAFGIKSFNFNKEQDQLILDYNHCRFIDKFTLKKKEIFQNNFFMVFEHMKTLKYNFYFSFVYYLLSIFILFFTFHDIFYYGYISDNFIYTLTISAFLSCSEIDTIFTQGSKYNLLSILLKKNYKTMIYFIFGFFVFLIAMTMIIFQFFGTYNNYDSILDCINVLVSLTLADSVKIIFDEISMDSYFGLCFIFIFVIFFNLSFLQILLGIITVDFQRAKSKFKTYEEEKKKKIENLRNDQKKNLMNFKNKNNSKSNLKKGVKEFYKKRIMNNKGIHPRDVKFEKKISLKKEKKNILGSKKTKDDLDILKINKKKKKGEIDFLMFEDEIKNYIGLKTRKLSEKINILKEDKNDKEVYHDGKEIVFIKNKFNKVIRNSIFEFIVQIRYYSQSLEDYFIEMEELKNKNKFSLMLVIAIVELCDNYLENLKLLEIKVMSFKTY